MPMRCLLLLQKVLLPPTVTVMNWFYPFVSACFGKRPIIHPYRDLIPIMPTFICYWCIDCIEIHYFYFCRHCIIRFAKKILLLVERKTCKICAQQKLTINMNNYYNIICHGNQRCTINNILTHTVNRPELVRCHSLSFFACAIEYIEMKECQW